MNPAVILLVMIGGAGGCTLLALFGARSLGLDRVINRGSASTYQSDLALSALGLAGLIGTLFLLLGGSEFLGLSRIGTAMLILVSATVVALAIRPDADQPHSADSAREENRRSRAA